MSEVAVDQPQPKPRRAPRASLGSPEGEDIFGTFDPKVARRFFSYLGPHRKSFAIAQGAVLLSAASQLSVPLLIGSITGAVQAHDAHRFHLLLVVFVAASGVFAACFFSEQWLSQRLANRVIFDVRRHMFAHFQDVSLSFMDKTHVGRLMSRLQGDVGALQEFLENTTGAVGDFVMLVGIAVILLTLDLQLGLLTLLVLPALIAIRAVWLPYSKRAFRRARDASSNANSALAENINGVRTVQETRREALNFELYAEKVRENFKAQVGAAWMSQIMVPTHARRPRVPDEVSAGRRQGGA